MCTIISKKLWNKKAPVGLLQGCHEASQDLSAKGEVGDGAGVEQVEQARHVLVPAATLDRTK